MKQTSIKSYHEILPLLPHRRRIVYQALKMQGPCTARYIQDYLRKFANVDGANKRFSELERMGLIKSKGNVVDRTTNRTAALWSVCERPKYKPLNGKKLP